MCFQPLPHSLLEGLLHSPYFLPLNIPKFLHDFLIHAPKEPWLLDIASLLQKTHVLLPSLLSAFTDLFAQISILYTFGLVLRQSLLWQAGLKSLHTKDDFGLLSSCLHLSSVGYRWTPGLGNTKIKPRASACWASTFPTKLHIPQQFYTLYLVNLCQSITVYHFFKTSPSLWRVSVLWETVCWRILK